MLKILNRNIYLFLAVFLVILLATGTFYYYVNFQKAEELNMTSGSVEEIKIPMGWKNYENDILGISFSYPPEWGDPYTEPSRSITDLARINERYGYTGSYFSHMVKIRFSREKTPVIDIYNDEYEGRLYPNAYAYRFGPIDNFLEMKESGDICDYEIEFDHRPNYEGIIDEVYVSCNDKVRTYITRRSPPLYNYLLKDSSFIKLQNGHFDNAFIEYFYGSTQSPNDKMGLQDLLKEVDDNYQEDKENFIFFVNSINTFEPDSSQKISSQVIMDDDPNVTTIRKYYFEITKGNLENAYDMYQDKRINFGMYEEWYGDTLTANPVDFKKISDTRYQFKVQFQEHNQEQELYRVVMEVNEGKIIPISSEMIVTNPVSFENMVAFVKQRQSKTYLVLSENGKEQILNQGSDSPLGWEDGPVISGPLEFSPKGNYLISDVYGWEWRGTNIYDIENKETVLELISPNTVSFTPDERYLFTCAENDFGGIYYGKVYFVPDFKEYDIISGGYNNISCEYDEDNQVIRFTMDVYSSEIEQAEKRTKVVEFSTITGETRTISD